MKIVYGDLLEMTDFDVIIHGCNCFNTMGKGIAYQIAQKWPSVWYKDHETIKGDKDKLGTLTYVSVGEMIVVNAYTQYNWGKNRVSVSYSAISSCFEKIAGLFNGKRIGYPKIGAGLGGGDWNKIAQIIDYKLKGQDHTLVLLKNSK